MERIVHSQERLALMEALKHIPEAIVAEIAGLPENVRRFKPSPDDWSINEVVGHLLDKAGLWYRRLYMVCSQTDPILPAFDGEQSVHDNNYQETANIEALLNEFRAKTVQTVDMLDNQPDWTRLGRHAEIGRRSLHQWVE